MSDRIWTGAIWVDSHVCQTCYQPECASSSGGARLPAGAIPTRLQPGEREYRGYNEWAVHPDEAIFTLHRGFALVNGEPHPVRFIHNEAYVTQIRIQNPVTIEETMTDQTMLEQVAA